MLGGFLGIEIPLFILTYFKYFRNTRNLIWFFTFAIGIISAGIIYYIVSHIIYEDYRIKILFDTTPYTQKDNTNEKI